jgi:hypothetical protein
VSTQGKQPKHKKEPIEFGFGISLGEWIISGFVGLCSGLLAAGATIRDRFGEELKKWPGFRKDLADHEKDLGAINEKFKGKPELWREHQEAIDIAKEAYAQARDAKLQNEFGILTRGEKLFSVDTFKGLTKGTYQRFGFSGKSTEGRIIFNSVVGAVIGAAATLSFFNGVASRHKIERIEDAVSPDNRQSR